MSTRSPKANYEAARKQTSIFYVLVLFWGSFNIGQEHGIAEKVKIEEKKCGQVFAVAPCQSFYNGGSGLVPHGS